MERESKNKKPVEFPSAPATSTGYPEHKQRWQASAFKQRRAAKKAEQDGAASSREQNTHQNFEQMDSKRIDRENQNKLDSMTPAEIAKAQEDLLNGLDPEVIQRLLARANIDETNEPSPFDQPLPPIQSTEIRLSKADSNPKSTRTEQGGKQKAVRFEEPAPAQETPAAAPRQMSSKKIALDYNEDQEPKQVPEDLFPLADLRNQSTHFPSPPTLPDLDPSDPNFLATLHEKYFPDLPADPSKLAWMAPVPTEDSVADKESAYYPHAEIAVSALRFDFKGRFLSPRVSRRIPTSKGLHHHGLAPEAAGYTVAELAILVRSAVPAQRCMAFQMLGRIMYRLGRGEWGRTEDDPIAMGVWASIKEGRVIEALTAAASIDGGHRGSQAYATEALWLFEKGGWKDKTKGR